MIFYSRCNFSADGGAAIHCFDLVYPQQAKRAFDYVVTRSDRSLRPVAAQPLEALASKQHARSVECLISHIICV